MSGYPVCKPMVTGTGCCIVAMDGEEYPCERIDNEEHCRAEVEEADHGAPVHIDVPEEQSSDAKEAVEDADACEIPCRHEMADALFFRRIKDANRNRHKRHIMPCGKDEQFQFGFVATSEDVKTVELVQRIKPQTCLRVRQMNRRLQGKPEVREAVGKLALARHVRIGERTTADDECLRMDVVCA